MSPEDRNRNLEHFYNTQDLLDETDHFHNEEQESVEADEQFQTFGKDTV